MFCYVETDYMIAGPPMSFGMMKGNNKYVVYYIQFSKLQIGFGVYFFV